jgi:translation initiation factor 2 alpha subunit (eIF-2alpha)
LAAFASDVIWHYRHPVSRSNLQVCQVIDLTHGHRHCDLSLVKVMSAGKASNSEASNRMACSAAHPEPNEKDRSKAKAM